MLRVSTKPPKVNSAFQLSWVCKRVPASAGKAKAGMVHSVSGWTRGVQVKLWNPLRTRAIPEHLRDVFTTRRYTNPSLPYLTLPANRYVFRFHLNCSSSTAGPCRWSGSEFQTVGYATKCTGPKGAMANLRNELHAVFMSAYSAVSLVCGVHFYYAVTLLPWCCFCVWCRRVVIETTVQDKSMKLSTASASSVSLTQKRSTNVWGTCHDLTLAGVG